MSRSSRVLANVSFGYVQLLASSAFGLWFTPFLLRHVGSTDFGLWSAGLPILAYVGLVDFGVLTIFQRDVAFALGEAEGDPRKIADLGARVGATLRLVLWQVPILIAGVAVAWLLLPKSWDALHLPLGMLLACFVLTFPLRIYHALLAGLQELKFLGAVALASWALGALVSAALVAMGWRLNALAVSWTTSQLFTYGACFARVRSRHPAALGGSPGLGWDAAKASLGKGFWVVVSQVAVMMVNGTDLLVIAAVLGPSAVTPYTITDKLVTMANNIPLMIMSAAMPGLSELSSSASRHRLEEVSISLTRVVLLMSGLIATVVVFVNQGFVGWWIGAQHFGGQTLVIVLVCDMLVAHWTSATGYGLFSLGYERALSLTGVVNGAVTLGATVLLTRSFGAIGAPIASMGTRLLLSQPVLLTLMARATGGSVKNILLAILAWAWRLALLVVAGIFAARVWVPHTLVELIAAGILAVAAYGVVMAPLALSGPLGPYVRPRLARVRQRLAGRAA